MATNTNILAVGTTDATSANQSVDSGNQVTLKLIGSQANVPLNAAVLVEVLGSDGNFRAVPSLEMYYQRQEVQVQGPLAAYRVHRVNGTVGVDVVS